MSTQPSIDTHIFFIIKISARIGLVEYNCENIHRICLQLKFLNENCKMDVALGKNIF